ncbi:MAG TPA: hypothetical protein VM240_11815 [Verrucomicrobiae bacterium]|nr:hypothetical protein [Verrucomicrobiae bacterium]
MKKNAQDLLESRRDFLVKALSAGMLVGGAGWNLPALASLFGKLPGRLPGGRSVFEIKGEVLVNGRPATERTVLAPSDKIVTGANSYIIAAVGQNAFIVRDRSVLELNGANPLKQAFRLVSGKFLGVFGKLSGKQSLAINTPAATIGIRGTGVYAESDPDKTYLCTCYGTTDLVARADFDADASAVKPKSGAKLPEPERELVSATHHDAPKYILTNPEKGKRITAAPFLNHTDLELMTLEALVGRKVPFGLPDSQYEGPRRDY